MPQLVGSACARCGGRIHSEIEAAFCPGCDQPVHERCCSASGEEGACRMCGSPANRGDHHALGDPREGPSDSPGLLWHLFSMHGRSPRSAYFLHSVLDGVVGIAVIIAGSLLLESLGKAADLVVGVWTLIVFAVMGWSEIAVTVRRLHDLDRPGAHFLLLMIPVYNLYLQIVLFCRSGTIGENRFGPDPLAARGEPKTEGEVLLEQGTRHEINGDWDLAFDCYKAAAEALRGQPDEEYAINCIRRLQEKLALSESAQRS